jgi:ribosomal protein L12E/L44/L45/RPP1/RPP2
MLRCMQTSMRVSVEARDALARIAADELGGVSLDEALRIILCQHETAAAVARLEADPEALADYQREAQEWAELDVRVEG